ncbi:MAG: HAD family hydrolase [Crenarchaeota archaeon]|nr:HAD family hydrolase [Thermoproteota archaeon]
MREAGWDGIEAVLFDMDGTIIDSVENVVKCWVWAFRQKGIPVTRDQILDYMGRSADDILRTVSNNEEREILLQVYKLARQCSEKSWRKEVKLYPGVKETLEYLKNKGYRLGLVTSSHEDRTLEFLEYFGIKDYFDVIQCYEEGAPAKPDPYLLLRALEKLDLEPSQAVYVGDALVDCLAAKNISMKFILVQRPWSPRNHLRCRPDKVIKEIYEIKEFL